MKLRSVYSPKLILTAQAQFLRVMTRVVEQFSHLDLADFSTVSDVLSRLAAYVREFGDDATAEDSAPVLSALNRYDDGAEAADSEPAFTVDYRRLFAESSELDDAALTLAVTTLLQDFQSAPQDVFRRIADYLRTFAEEVAEPTDALLGFAVVKRLTDLPILTDGAPVFGVRKALADATQMLDQLRLSPRLGQYETLIVSEARKLATGKLFAETSKPLDLARLTPLLRFVDTQADFSEQLTLSAGLKINESGQYVEGFGDYVTEDYFLKTPQLLETAFLFDVNKSLAEGAAAADALSLAFATLFADVLNAPTDTAKLTPLLGLLDTQALTDSRLFSVGKALSELATFTESTRLVTAKPLTETPVIVDALTRVATQYRTFADSFSAAESFVRRTAKPFTDSATPADAPKKHLFLQFLEGGDYAVSGYFEVDDYVVGGIATGDSLTIV